MEKEPTEFIFIYLTTDFEDNIVFAKVTIQKE